MSLLAAALFLAAMLAALHVERWRTERQQRRVVAVQAAELDRQLGQLAIVPRLLADDPRLIAALAPGESRPPAPGARHPAHRASLLLERTRARSGAAVLYLMDADGLTVAASNWRESSSFVGSDYGFRPYFLGAIEGRETTFFAVGATTGEPGYFIAHPVADEADEGGRDRADRADRADRVGGADEIGAGPGGRGQAGADGADGVVVAKVSLDALVDAWRERPHRSVVTDELGVVILSTDPGLLYTRSAALDEAARARLASDRRYRPNAEAVLALEGAGARLNGARQLAVSRALDGEPWTLHLLTPRRPLLARAARSAAVVLALAAVALLLFERSRRQRRLADAEQRAAKELERLVAERTEALERAQRALIAESNFAMLGRMSAAVNHEINQPLASLRLDLATLRRLTEREPPPLGEIRQTVVDSERTTRRIGRVVATLRRVARRGEGDFTTLDPGRLVDEVVATLRHERAGASEALRRGTRGAGLTVVGNAVLLQQALLNLLHNALDAVREAAQPRVTIEVVPAANGRVALSVADNGPGVEPTLAGRLFEPFATASTDGEGLGLGLALARQIAEDHGGTLTYRAGKAGGSVFTLCLPLQGRRDEGAERAADAG